MGSVALLAGALAATSLPGGSSPDRATGRDTLVLRVGDPVVAGADLQPFSVRWEQRWTGPEGADEHQRFVEESLSIRESSEEPLIERRQRWIDPDDSGSVAVNLLRRGTLAPRRWQSRDDAGEVIHIDFHGPALTAVFVGDVGDPAVLVHREVAEAPFDARAAALLLAALPLEDGLLGRFPIVPLRPPVLNEPVVEWYRFSVDGRETVQSPALGTVEVWRVETNQSMTFWVADHPPYVVQVSFPLRGGESVFRIVEASPSPARP